MKKKRPRFARFRKKSKKIRKSRRSKKNTHPLPQILVLVSSIVTDRITLNKPLIATHKYFRKNINNNKFIVQKKRCKNSPYSLCKKQKQTAVCFEYFLDKNSVNSVTRILKKEAKISKTLEGLANDLRRFKTTVLSFDSIINSLSFSPIGHYQILVMPKQVLDDRIHKNQTFALTNQWTVTELVKTSIHSPGLQVILNPATYFVKKIETENNIIDYLCTILNLEENYNIRTETEDNQQPEVEEEVSEKNPVIQEDDSPYRHILELPSPYSLEQQQAFKDGLWDTDSPTHKIFDVTKPYRGLYHAIISHPLEEHKKVWGNPMQPNTMLSFPVLSPICPSIFRSGYQRWNFSSLFGLVGE